MNKTIRQRFAEMGLVLVTGLTVAFLWATIPTPAAAKDVSVCETIKVEDGPVRIYHPWEPVENRDRDHRARA